MRKYFRVHFRILYLLTFALSRFIPAPSLRGTADILAMRGALIKREGSVYTSGTRQLKSEISRREPDGKK